MSRNVKSIIAYTSLGILAFVFDKVYSLFSHGVDSKTMANMWIWLLCLGSVFYLILELVSFRIKKDTVYRLCTNIYNSGIAVLITGMLLQGIFDIAGTSSIFIPYYRVTGIVLISVGLVLILTNIIKSGIKHKNML